MKPVLVIDFDGTICADRYWRTIDPVINKKIQTRLFGEDRSIVHDWLRGGWTAEEVNGYLAKELALDYHTLWSLFVSDCQTMHLPSAIVTALSRLRGTYTTVLMTGNMDSFSRFTVPALQLDEQFDYISNSYEEKKHKTDDNGSLFTDWAKKLNVSMAECTLIDDNTRCCELFSGLGGVAYQTTGLDHTIQVLDQL